MGVVGPEAPALLPASRDPEALGAVLHILLRVIEARLRQRSGCARGRLGAVSFVQRFGSALNAHVHFHCCVIDGVFAVGEDGQVHFAEAAALTPGRPRRGAAAGARSRVALVRPRRHSRPSRCARHGRLAPRRGLLAGCRGAHRRPRPCRPGAAATLKTADWIVDLGPEGGDGGGHIVAQGTPEADLDCRQLVALPLYAWIAQPAAPPHRQLLIDPAACPTPPERSYAASASAPVGRAETSAPRGAEAAFARST